jgi:carbonic anhydrase
MVVTCIEHLDARREELPRIVGLLVGGAFVHRNLGYLGSLTSVW